MQASMQSTPSTPAGPAQADSLVQAFHQACTDGDAQTASSLLRQLDFLWLGFAVTFREREQAVRTLRQLREQLDKSRKRGLFRWH
jgi:hypothetical protein